MKIIPVQRQAEGVIKFEAGIGGELEAILHREKLLKTNSQIQFFGFFSCFRYYFFFLSVIKLMFVGSSCIYENSVSKSD